MWFTVEKEELKRMAVVLQELGLSYAETVEVVNEMAKDVNNAKKLWRDTLLDLHLGHRDSSRAPQ